MKEILKVSILGAGTLGSQIAFQSAIKGFNVVVYDINSDAFSVVSQVFQWMEEYYVEELGATPQDIEATYNRIAYALDLEDAVDDVDLVIEAVPEDMQIKKELYTKLGKLAPAKTIFATNSSTFLPSQLMEFTGRPDRFLALHFANMLVKFNTAEIMGSPRTDPAVFATVVEFAKQMGMVPIQMEKEKEGYILNSLLIPFLTAAAELLVTKVADVETIDKTWKIATGAPGGPFEMFDIIGLNTMYNIARAGDVKAKLFAHYLKENFIDKGKLGYLSGEGFYKYPRVGDKD